MSRPRTRNAHLPKYIQERHGSYWYQPPNEKARRIADDLAGMYKFMAELATPAGPVVTVGDLLDRYTRTHVPTLSARTQQDYQRHIEKLRRVFGNETASAVLPKDIGRFLASDTIPGRVYRVKLVSILSTAYDLAIGAWFVDGITVNPCKLVRKFKSPPRDRYITDAEFEIIRTAMPPRVKIAMDLALLCGQRQGDILSLTWEKVSETHVHFKQGKTGKRLKVLISPALQEVLDRAKALTPQLPRIYVVKSRKGKPYTSGGFRAVWQRRMRKLLKTGAIKTRLTFHDIRAKTVSDSKSLQEAMERAGHTNMSMTRSVYDRNSREVTSLK